MSSPSGGRSSSGCATTGSSRSRTSSTGRTEIADGARRPRRARGRRRDRRRATASPGGSPPAAGTARRRSSTSSTAAAGSSSTRAPTCSASELARALTGLDLGDFIGVDGTAFADPPRRALAARRRLDAAGEEPAPAAGQVPRARGHRAPLPPPRARPDRQPRGPGAVSQARRDDRRGPRVARLRGLRRGRDAGPAAALRRRAGAAVHHPPQRPRPRPLPADRDRALPQAPDRRRDRARLRARQGLPQRGDLVQAQPRVHDARVVRGLRRLRRRRRAAREPGRRGRPSASSGRPWSSATGSRSTSRRPWRRVTLRDAIRERTGIDILEHPTREALAAAMDSEASPEEGWGKLVDGLLSKEVEPTLIQPTFVIDYPVEMSPFAKRHRDDERLVERWEADRRRVRDRQRVHRAQRPRRAAAPLRAAGRGAAARRRRGAAVRRDLPRRRSSTGCRRPAGVGLGIDRLVMLLTGASSLREVVLFPAMRS